MIVGLQPFSTDSRAACREELKMNSRRPPDGGYGWVVVMSAFFTMGLTAAVLKNFGLFFLDIQSHFQVMTSTTSWVTSTTIAMFHLGAPLASVLSLRFSQGGHHTRRSAVSLGNVAGLSGPQSAVALPHHGRHARTGHLLRMDPCQQHGEPLLCEVASHRYSIASSGECVFAILFSPFFQWLIETYSWQGALIIIGVSSSNLCVCGALMRPLEAPQSPIQETKDNLEGDAAELPPKRKVIFQFSLLRKPELLFYILFAIFAAAGFFIPPLFLVPFANSLGMDKYWPALILSILALADLAGRLLCGWLANMRVVRNLQLLTMVVTLLGVVLMLLPINQSYWAIMVFVCLYGFLFGCVVAIHVTSIVDIVPWRALTTDLGSLCCWLVEPDERLQLCLLPVGLASFSSAVFLVLVDRILQKKKCIEAEDQRSNTKDNPDAEKVN
ncbi:hypothetical protein F7725_013151 [Dissostichus mawsoni]|uniref:Uncharacterized protein n=1 Tax=Dissostichus mawsoni TaxID=36200 RepID=A0A7J5YRR3_DISMA|nr:hypothetical protein F7725_013151 [Dissostichus mawsoni]